MAYDQQLASQVRAALSRQASITEREMFGGIGFMVAGNMACGVIGEELIVRVGPDAYEEYLQADGVNQFDMTGRAMRGWVSVSSTALASESELRRWVEIGTQFALTLPPK